MACFVVPGGEAVVTTVIQKVLERREKKAAEKGEHGTGTGWSRKLGWLNRMLWGGTLLLALEHVWHGAVSYTHL
ncbi:MAG: hypothetical protein N3E40_04600, partial [Dehalococcoidia bacterium]|nr:hypothetical protein [Dehalococcoidia bacterium]